MSFASKVPSWQAELDVTARQSQSKRLCMSSYTRQGSVCISIQQLTEGQLEQEFAVGHLLHIMLPQPEVHM